MKLNKKGQTLILFVIFLPLILGMCAFVVDLGLVLSTKSHVKEVTKTILNTKVDLNPSDIKDLLKKNNIDTANLEISQNSNYLEISNKIKVDSIFGTIIGINAYKINIKMKFDYTTNQIINE